MKNFIRGVALYLIAMLLALPASAGFIGHSIGGSAEQGGSNLFSPNTATIENAEFDIDYNLIDPNIEFSTDGIVGWLNGVSTAPIDISIVADFYEDSVYGPILDIRVFPTNADSGVKYTISGLTLTFSSMNYVELPNDNFLLNAIYAIPFEYDPIEFPDLNVAQPLGYHETLQGLQIGHAVNSPLFTISFLDYRVDEGREDRFQLGYVLEDASHPPETVVPVPAAAPMTLLGLGVLALARRFRRKKS